MLVKYGSVLAKPSVLHLECNIYIHVQAMERTNLAESVAHAVDHPCHHRQLRPVFHNTLPHTLPRHHVAADETNGYAVWNHPWFLAAELVVQGFRRQNEIL